MSVVLGFAVLNLCALCDISVFIHPDTKPLQLFASLDLHSLQLGKIFLDLA